MTPNERRIHCVTHAGHSIAFLHFVTLWPWPLTLWRNINWWARYREGLSLCQVWWLYFQPFLFYRADKHRHTHTHTHTHTQTPLTAILPRLQSAWVRLSGGPESKGLKCCCRGLDSFSVWWVYCTIDACRLNGDLEWDVGVKTPM